MQKTLLIILTTFIFSLTKATTPNCTLQFFLTGIKTEQELVVTKVEDDKSILGKTKVTTGQFQLKLELSIPTLVSVSITGADEKAYLYLEPGTVSVNGTLKQPWDLVVKGSPSHQDLLLFRDSLLVALDTYKRTNKAATDVPRNAITAYLHNLLSRRSNAFSAAFCINKMKEVYAEHIYILEALYNKLSETVQSSNAAVEVKKYIDVNNTLQPGNILPDFTFPSSNNKAVKISDYRGYYTLVDCWASWCGPCRRENPFLKEALATYKDRGFRILSISFDDNREHWLKVVADDKMEWQQVSELKGWDNEFGKSFKIESIPFNILLDPQGRIVAKNLRGGELFKVLKEKIGLK